MKLSEEVVWRFANDDQVLVLNLSSEHYFELNASASFLWKELAAERAHTTGDLVRALINEFRIDSQAAQTDVESFLSSLRTAGCLVE
jgi:hypothetical protein